MFIYNYKVKEFITETLLILLAFTLPFSTRLNSFFLIMLFVNWLLQGEFKSKLKIVFEQKVLILLTLLYLAYLIGLLYTNNFNDALKILTKRSSFLILPIVVGSSSIKKITFVKVSVAFIVAILIAANYSLIILFLEYWNKYKSFQDFELLYISRDYLSNPLELHPTYFSIYSLFAISLIVYLYIQFKKSNLNLIIVISTCLFLFCFSLLLSARMPLLGFILISFIYLTTYLIIKRKYFLFVLLVVVTSASLIKLYSHPLINKRFAEIKETEWKPPVGIHHNSTNLRIGIFSCSSEAIKEYWLWGIGTGDVQDYLNNCYKSNNFSDVMYLNKYNTHNIYLDTLIMIGIFGLILLFANFIFPAILALETKNYIYLFFLLFFCICGLGEALFNTQKGVVFFSLFNCILLINQSRLNKS